VLPTLFFPLAQAFHFPFFSKTLLDHDFYVPTIFNGQYRNLKTEFLPLPAPSLHKPVMTTPLYRLAFLGANGFPARAYNPILSRMSAKFAASSSSYFDIVPVDYSAHLSPENKDWKKCVDKLSAELASLKDDNTPLLAVGHSAGGALLSCVATLHPQLMQSLIIIDPPMFRPAFRLFVEVGKVLPRGVVERVHPLVAGAMRKRGKFSDRQDAEEYFRGRKLFQSFNEEFVESFLEHGIVEHGGEEGGGATLSFSKENEANMYLTTPGLDNRNFSSPYVGQYGNKDVRGTFFHSHEYQFLSKPTVGYLQGLLGEGQGGRMKFREFQNGHFWPMYDPDDFAETIADEAVKLITKK